MKKITLEPIYNYQSILQKSNIIIIMQEDQWQVIIVGAGPSGIGTAKTLQQQKIPYIILQARDRVGGRVYSQKIDGVQMDLGASWIHSYGNHNPLRKQVKKLGWKACVLQKRQIGRRYIDGQIGQKYSKQVWEPMDQHYDQFFQIVNKFGKQSKEDLSVYEAGSKYLQQHYHKLSDIERRYLTLIINMTQHYEGSSAKDLSAKNYKYRTMYGRDYMPGKSYGCLLKKISQNLKIRFKVRVKSIKYGKGVEVLTEDGKVFKSKKIIASIPLGILKKNLVQFIPQLPPGHQRAIEKLGMGVMNKIIVSFRENFWGSCRWMSIGCSERGKYPHFYNFSRGDKHILCCFVTDDFAKKIQNLSNEQIMQDFLTCMKKTFKDKKIEVKDYRISRWNSDENCFGSYTSFHVGSSFKDCLQLRKSLKNTLWMVGQHCFAEHIGTAGGAYQTGKWAAEEVISLCKNQKEEKGSEKLVEKEEKKATKIWK